MTVVDDHPHLFDRNEWPFDDPTNAFAITTVRVLEDGYPVLRVSHDEDGDWQILCDTTVDIDDARVVCLGCAYQRDKTIGQLHDLPKGWTAIRDYIGGPWYRAEKEEEDDDEQE
jgi:hypothetical protein